MSQYSTGTASVTNGSATVTGSSTLWLANVSAGDSFTIASTGVMYDVASVDSDTQITLSAPYAGTTASGVVYAIGTGFTVPDSFPEMSQGDIETATIFTRAMRKIQGKFSSILAGGANANFTTMPQVGGDPIVESGSNADGEWTRWSDGTQTAVKRQAQTGVSIAGGGFVDISSLMGAAFIANPAYGLTGRFVAGNGDILYGFFASSFSTDIALFSNIGTSPSVTAPEWNTTGTTTATSYFVDICAIGRWK